MQLNRAHALALVGSLTAVACGGESKHQSPAALRSSGGAAGSGGTLVLGGSGTGGVGGTAGSDAIASGAGGTDAGAAGGSAGTGGAGGTTPGSAGACSETTSGGQPGCPPSCTDYAVQQECSEIGNSLKPYLANRALQCVAALPSSALCDLSHYYDCIDRALRTSCYDASVVSSCDDVVAACASGDTPIAASACIAYVSGLTSLGQRQFTSCARNTCDLTACVQSFTPVIIE